MKNSHTAFDPLKIVMPEIQLNDLKRAARNITPSNTDKIINDNLMFAEGVMKPKDTGIEKEKNEGKIKPRNPFGACVILFIVVIFLGACILFVELVM